MSKTLFATTLTIILASACAVEESPRPSSDPRDGLYTVESEVEADAIESEIFRDGVLVAVASLEADASVVTLVESGKEMAAPLSAGYDPHAELERYEGALVDVSMALELSEPASDDVEFRLADECGYVPFYGGSGSICAVSWCGSSCWALDCGPGWNGAGEIHVMYGCG